ncbi:peptidyl-prolyl cis-trans isomerase [Streptomyces spongiae]|uniref:Peptidyl-prolyl cis-trans isomerase n=1 Tax=Streptomyces spongiae TaxID=565072 RepID=A0A5N8XUZ7_9ACTN|nr:peptidyl-prolyl cis-trans isomerase [Streptomyces spongiae]MPY63152.1 peptidyl-prolyl cis-trans isomerase [Streptomyces spongiae]
MTGPAAPHAHPHTHAHPGAAALVHGEPVTRARVDAFLRIVPPRDRETRPDAVARAERQRRRWATQVVVADELARRACIARGLRPPPVSEVAPSGVLAVAEADVADLGSIVAAVLAHSPAARVLLDGFEDEQEIPEEAVRDYYDRNRDRFLTQEALRRGVDPFDEPTQADVLPYERAREGIERELRRAAGHRSFFAWLDQARTNVVYTPGHEHPGDPSHPDHEHRH